MTAPTINGTKYPQSVDELLRPAFELTVELGEVPSRNRLMREFRIGAPKADELRSRLLAAAKPATTKPVPVPFDYAEPIGPDPLPAPVVPESMPLIAPDPTPAPVVTPAAPPAEVTPVGHPGSNITTDPATDRPSGRGWAYVGVILGGVVSIAANVAHTYLPKPPEGAPAGWTPALDWSPSPLAVAFSVFWPVALFVAVEILTRVPWGEGAGSVFARVAGVLPVAVVAAVVSYRHLSGLLAHFGEDPLTVAIGPLAVDGLMVMASAALLATSRYRTRK